MHTGMVENRKKGRRHSVARNELLMEGSLAPVGRAAVLSGGEDMPDDAATEKAQRSKGLVRARRVLRSRLLNSVSTEASSCEYTAKYYTQYERSNKFAVIMLQTQL